MTRQRLCIISISIIVMWFQSSLRLAFLTVTTLNLEKFLIYGGKKIRKKTFISLLLFKRAGERWHFHFTVQTQQQRVPMAGSSRSCTKPRGQGTGSPNSECCSWEPLTSSLCLCSSSQPLSRWWTLRQDRLLLCKGKARGLEGAKPF